MRCCGGSAGLCTRKGGTFLERLAQVEARDASGSYRRRAGTAADDAIRRYNLLA
jgi:hypothetical protein